MPSLEHNRFFVSCDELFEGRQGNVYSFDGNREYTRNFLVRIRRKEMGPVAVCLAPGLPLPGAIYQTPLDYDLLARMVKMDARQRDRDDWEAWIVTATYSTRPNSGNGQQFTETPDNPEDEPLEIDSDFEVEQLALPYDRLGKPFLNSAQMPFTPAPTFPVAFPILNITRNELDYSIVRAAEFAFAVNAKPFLGYPAECVQCYPPKAKQMFRGKFTYVRVSYKLKFAVQLPTIQPGGEFLSEFKSFQPRLLDQGLMILSKNRFAKDGTPLPNDWLPMLDGRGQPMSQAGLLNGDGLKQTAEVGGAKVPIFLPFDLYRKVDMGQLLLRGLGTKGIVQKK